MKVIYCVLALILSIPVFAQPDSLWSRNYGGGDDDWCFALVQTTDGGYVLAGHSGNTSASSHVWIVKTDGNGDVLWNRSFGGSDYDQCYAAIQTLDGGYALAGRTYSFGAVGWDAWIVKTNAGGDSLWGRTFGGESDDWFSSLIQTSDGNFAVAGLTGSFGFGGGDAWLVKISPGGDSLWSRTFGGGSHDWCSSIIENSNGELCLAGGTQSFGSASTNFWLVVTSANGDTLWSRTYGGNSHDECRSIIESSDGGYVLAGSTYSFGTWPENFWVVKTSSLGDSVWSQVFSGAGEDECFSVVQALDEGCLLGGTGSYGSGGTDFWLAKVDASGNDLWVKTFGGVNNDACTALIRTSDDGYALAGSSSSFGGADYDYWLVKTGSELLAEEAPTPMNPAFLYANYPNPFNSETEISYDLPISSHVSLTVYDLVGRQCATLVNSFERAGHHTSTFVGSELVSGVYFCVLRTLNYEVVEKMVLIK